MKKKYNITLEDYTNLLNRQGGVCGLCGGMPNKRYEYFCVDHNHKTGKVRGLLCSKCNMYVGVYENKKFMKEVEDYVKKNR